MKPADCLLVEDDDQLAFMMDGAAELSNLSLFRVASAFDAVEYLKTYVPKLIILDLMLPDLNGVELARRLRSDSRVMHVPIVLWSEYTDSPILKNNRYLFDAIYEKPGANVIDFVTGLKAFLGETSI